jgi:hypothetical protein
MKLLKTNNKQFIQGNAHSPTINKTISQASHNSNNIHMNKQRISSDNNNNGVDLKNNILNNNNLNRPGVLQRSNSRLSHVTRDVNDSYAYTNVQQYIEENDLMPPEKSHSIKKWVKEVNAVFDDWEKKTIEKHIEDLFL